jgi:hypothetical protein
MLIADVPASADVLLISYYAPCLQSLSMFTHTAPLLEVHSVLHALLWQLGNLHLDHRHQFPGTLIPLLITQNLLKIRFSLSPSVHPLSSDCPLIKRLSILAIPRQDVFTVCLCFGMLAQRVESDGAIGEVDGLFRVERDGAGVIFHRFSVSIFVDQYVSLISAYKSHHTGRSAGRDLPVSFLLRRALPPIYPCIPAKLGNHVNSCFAGHSVQLVVGRARWDGLESGLQYPVDTRHSQRVKLS